MGSSGVELCPGARVGLGLRAGLPGAARLLPERARHGSADRGAPARRIFRTRPQIGPRAIRIAFADGIASGVGPTPRPGSLDAPVPRVGGIGIAQPMGSWNGLLVPSVVVMSPHATRAP